MVPIVNPEVAAIAAKHNLAWVPGCMTPTEIHSAQHFGAQMVKIFPANILGPDFIASIRDIFPGQLFMPTGGVELQQDNITAWFKAGVCAVGMGSKLITEEVMEAGKYEALYNQTLKTLQMIKKARASRSNRFCSLYRERMLYGNVCVKIKSQCYLFTES